MSEIRTRPATPEYRDNWPRIFGRKKRKRRPPKMPRQVPPEAVR